MGAGQAGRRPQAQLLPGALLRAARAPPSPAPERHQHAEFFHAPRVSPRVSQSVHRRRRSAQQGGGLAPTSGPGLKPRSYVYVVVPAPSEVGAPREQPPRLQSLLLGHGPFPAGPRPSWQEGAADAGRALRPGRARRASGFPSHLLDARQRSWFTNHLPKHRLVFFLRAALK